MSKELANPELTQAILEFLKKPESLIQFVDDQPGHDRWYQDNRAWWKKIKSGEFQQYYRKQYREI